jgi:small-conductance mechanosensitive channel
MFLSQAWLTANVFNNTIADYLRATGYLLGLLLALLIVRRLLVSRLRAFSKRTATDFDDFLADMFSQVRAASFVVLSLYLSTRSLKLEAAAHAVLRFFAVTILTFQAVLLLQKTVRYGIQKAFRRSYRNDPSAETMANNFGNVLGSALWAIGIIFILDNLGINISAIVAGLGITGVAVAMASQTVLADMFSAIAIFMDRPFHVGDFIVVETYMGTVESIGLKTTRIRSTSGELIIFSNADLTKSRIRNHGRSRPAEAAKPAPAPK